MEIRKIETIRNEFVEQLKSMLQDSFPKAVGFDIEYYIGEDMEGTRGIYIEIESKVFGKVFRKRRQMKDYEIKEDVEEPFTNEVINDLVLAGISYFNSEALRQKADDQRAKAIVANEFVNMIPRLLIHVN